MSARVQIAANIQGSGPALDLSAIVDPANIPAYDSNSLDQFDSVSGVLVNKATGYAVEDYSQVNIQTDNSVAETAAQSSNPYPPYVKQVTTYPGVNYDWTKPSQVKQRTYLIPGVHPNSVANFTAGAEILRGDLVTQGKAGDRADADHLRWGREWVYVRHLDANGQPEKRAVLMARQRFDWRGTPYEENFTQLDEMGLVEDPANEGSSVPVYGYYDYKDAHMLDNDPTMMAEEDELDASGNKTGRKVPSPGNPKPVTNTNHRYATRFSARADGQLKIASNQIRTKSGNLNGRGRTKTNSWYSSEETASPKVFLTAVNTALRSDSPDDWEKVWKLGADRIAYFQERRDAGLVSWRKSNDFSGSRASEQNSMKSIQEIVFSGEQMEMTHQILEQHITPEIFDKIREAEREKRAYNAKNRNRRRALQELLRSGAYKRRNKPIASGLTHEISPDRDASGKLIRKRTAQEILEAVTRHQAIGQLDTTDLDTGVPMPVVLDDIDIDYLESITLAYETGSFTRRGSLTEETSSHAPYAAAWEGAGFSEPPVVIAKEEIADLVAATELDGTPSVMPITRGIESDTEQDRLTRVKQFAEGERFIVGEGGMAYGNGENFSLNPKSLGGWHSDSGGSITGFLPKTASVVLVDDAKEVQGMVHEAVWSLDKAVRTPQDEGTRVTYPNGNTKQIFESTHGSVTSTAAGSIDPNDQIAFDQELALIKLQNRVKAGGTLRSQKPATQARIEALRDKMIDIWVALERSYDRSVLMSDPKNIKIRNAQRTIMHADYTTMAILLGFDAMVAGGRSGVDSDKGNNTKEILEATIKIHGRDTRGNSGSVGSTNHIMILNRSAIIVSNDPWHVDDYVETINQVLDVNGQPIYAVKS